MMKFKVTFYDNLLFRNIVAVVEAENTTDAEHKARAQTKINDSPHYVVKSVKECEFEDEA